MDMQQRTCCFTGHRHLPQSELKTIERRLEEETLKLIQKGVVFYGCGGALGFDMLAANTICKLKSDLKQIKLIMVLPCRGQDKYWDMTDKKKYAEILQKADKTVYVSGEYHPDCMRLRNRYLVDHSSFCLAYLTKNSGGTFYTVNYAKSQNIFIINIGAEI